MPAFSPFDINTSSPWWNAFTITPGMYNTALPAVARGIRVATAGNLDVTMAGGNRVVFQNVPAGATIPGFFKIVWSGTTTCTGLLGGLDANSADAPGAT